MPTFRSILIYIASLTVCGSNASAQYCVAGGPVAGTDSHISQVLLAGESGTIDYIIGCTGAIGVTDVTTISTDLGQSASYSLLVNFNSCGGFYEGDGEAWIDYDQSGTFEPSESLGSWTGTPPMINSFNFTVPGTAPTGITRMRVMLYEDLGGVVSPPLDPCASFTWGSVYDFSVNIVPWVDCSGTLGDDMASAIDVLSLPFSDSQNSSICYTDVDPAYNSADVYYRLEGVDAGTNWIDVSTCGSTFDTYLAIHDGQGNVIYYNDDAASCSPQSGLSVPIAENDTFFIVVQGWGTLEGDFTLTINETAGASLESKNLEEIIVYPNPTSDFLYLSSISEGVIELYNVHSQLVLARNLTTTTNEINLANLPEGIYLLRLSQNELVRTKKIIIKR